MLLLIALYSGWMMMFQTESDGQFSNPLAKLRRAKKCLEEVEEAIRQVASHFDGRFTKSTTPEGNHVFAYTGQKNFTTHDLSATAGDVLNNLRSALDQTISELTRLNGASDDGVYFPIADSERKFREAIKKSKIKLSGSHVVEFVASLRPYPGGNDLLSAIRKLNNQDKHRNLIAISQRITSPQLSIKDPEGTIYGCVLDFNFTEFDSPLGIPVIPTLSCMVSLVEGVIHELTLLAPQQSLS